MEFSLGASFLLGQSSDHSLGCTAATSSISRSRNAFCQRVTMASARRARVCALFSMACAWRIFRSRSVSFDGIGIGSTQKLQLASNSWISRNPPQSKFAWTQNPGTSSGLFFSLQQVIVFPDKGFNLGRHGKDFRPLLFIKCHWKSANT